MVLNHTSRFRGSVRHNRWVSRWLRTARFRIALCTAALLVVGGTSTLPQDAPSVEYQLKAAFLFNFAKFVAWPPDAFQSDKAPISLCVFRHDPFGGTLDQVIREKAINNRELLARRIKDLPELKTCQLVFVSETEERQLPEILSSLKGASALVVGESADFAANVRAIQRARRQASSKLLALARIVHDNGHPKGS